MSVNLLLKESGLNLMLVSARNDAPRGCNIFSGTGLSPVGNCFIAWVREQDEDAICFLAFGDGEEITRAARDLQKLWPGSRLEEKNQEAENLISRIFDENRSAKGRPLKLLVKGSPFQEKIWSALAEVNSGSVISYEGLALRTGGKNFTRAVASAVAKNNISYLIPCHRIIGKSGKIGKYRWGTGIKKQLIDWEKDQMVAS